MALSVKAAIIMTFLGAISSSSSLAEIWVISFAAVGGIVVFLGLLLEKIAEWKSEKHIIKPYKRLSECGWWILMIGIAVEIGVAVWSASDAWETRQMAIKNDPLNQPISDMYATVSIRLKKADREPRRDLRTVAVLDFHETDSHILVNLGDFDVLEANDFVTEVSTDEESKETSRRYVLHFHANDRITSDFSDIFVKASPGVGVLKPAVKDINRVATVEISAFFIPSDAQVEGGSVTLLINGQIPKYFTILPQKAFPPTIGMRPDTNGFGITILATNSSVSIVTQ